MISIGAHQEVGSAVVGCWESQRRHGSDGASFCVCVCDDDEGWSRGHGLQHIHCGGLCVSVCVQSVER